MLKSFQKLRGGVTLFHNPESIISRNIKNYIKENFPDRSKRSFDVEITEANPTPDQLKSINKWSNLEISANSKPLLVDWYHGKIAVDNESLAKQILDDVNKIGED